MDIWSQWAGLDEAGGGRKSKKKYELFLNTQVEKSIVLKKNLVKKRSMSRIAASTRGPWLKSPSYFGPWLESSTIVVPWLGGPSGFWPWLESSTGSGPWLESSSDNG